MGRGAGTGATCCPLDSYKNLTKKYVVTICYAMLYNKKRDEIAFQVGFSPS